MFCIPEKHTLLIRIALLVRATEANPAGDVPAVRLSKTLDEYVTSTSLLVAPEVISIKYIVALNMMKEAGGDTPAIGV